MTAARETETKRPSGGAATVNQRAERLRERTEGLPRIDPGAKAILVRLANDAGVSQRVMLERILGRAGTGG